MVRANPFRVLIAMAAAVLAVLMATTVSPAFAGAY
jgi:hypothetical protein